MVSVNEDTLEHARQLDQQDELHKFREQFIIPSKGDLHRTKLSKKEDEDQSWSEESIYLCGNSLGVQPKAVEQYVSSQLQQWAQRGVFGHFKPAPGSLIPNWVDVDERVKAPFTKIVGAQESEVVIMQTLTANLHILMTSFYRPTTEKYRIILEGKAFPSDHYVVESQLRLNGRNPDEDMILIEPPSTTSPLIPTDHILSVIDKYASTTALILLPGIQFYTGQLLDIQRITAHAHSHGIMIGWDLAHAAGNVPLQLHDWNVDFAAWCTYKYLNCGPGAVGGLFVHDRHTSPASTPQTNGTAHTHPARLTGWWGSSKATRFAMTNKFEPMPGAAAFQLSNPSILDMAAVLGSMSVFDQTDMAALRRKSLDLTAYLERLLLSPDPESDGGKRRYTIITPQDPQQRGAQLSVMLDDGLLDAVLKVLEEDGVVIDERKPNVIRVAPAPLYNSYEDVWRFVAVFRKACRQAAAEIGAK